MWVWPVNWVRVQCCFTSTETIRKEREFSLTFIYIYIYILTNSSKDSNCHIVYTKYKHTDRLQLFVRLLLPLIVYNPWTYVQVLITTLVTWRFCECVADTALDRLQPLLLGVFCVTVTALFSVWQLLPLLLLLVLKCPPTAPLAVHSSGAVWESRWPSWAVRPNEPSGFRGRKATLNHASALVSACP